MENSGKKAIRALILWLAVSACFIPSALADAPAYALYNDESTLSFIAIQNGAPVKGSFKHFDADIRFDPDRLKESSIKVTVDISSLTMADVDILSTLTSPEWFAADSFPKAIYQSQSITAADTPADYVAKGELTLKGHTVPLTLYFHMARMDADMAVANGSATIMRNQFAIGEGQWADDSAVKNEVRVEFHIEARKKQ